MYEARAWLCSWVSFFFAGDFAVCGCLVLIWLSGWCFFILVDLRDWKRMDLKWVVNELLENYARVEINLNSRIELLRSSCTFVNWCELFRIDFRLSIFRTECAPIDFTQCQAVTKLEKAVSLNWSFLSPAWMIFESILQYNLYRELLTLIIIFLLFIYLIVTLIEHLISQMYNWHFDVARNRSYGYICVNNQQSSGRAYYLKAYMITDVLH